MNIGFDAKRYFFNHTGLGNYSRNVVAHVAELRPNDRFILYSKPLSAAEFQKIDLPINASVRTIKRFSSIRRLFSYNDLWRKDQLSLYHGLSNELPLFSSSEVKKVVTIHDLLYLDFPKDYGFFNRHIYNIKTYRAAKRADVIVAISRATKDVLIDKMGIDEDKIFVLYQDCDPLFYKTLSQLELNAIKHRFKLPDHFILSVGSFTDRKNHLNLIKAFKNCSFKDDVKMVLIGGGHLKKKLESFVNEHGLKDKIIFLKVEETKDLVGVYQLAQASVYPSLKEGFGIPVLESLASRIPVATTETGSTREAGGKHAYYFDPIDVQSIKEAMEQMLAVGKIPNLEELHHHFKCFDAANNAKVLVGIYQNLLGESLE